MIEHILEILKGVSTDDTARQRFDNNLSGRLLYTIDAPVTQFQIAVLSGSWPIYLADGEWFNVTLSSPIDGRFEIVKVVSMNNDYLGVERGMEGTLPQLWEAATTVLSARITGDTLKRLGRKDELNRWAMTQEFQQGFLNRGDARFVNGLSIGGDDTEPDATIGTVSGMVAINAGIPLALYSSQLQFNGIGFPANPDLVEGQHLYVDKATHQIVGRRLEWYIGAFISAPAHLNNGDPMQPGMIYFNLISLRAMVWTGARWRDLISPGPGFLKQLVYIVDTVDQTEFLLGDPDMNGNVYELDLVNPETVHVFLDGLQLVQNVGFGGDFIVSVALNRITMEEAPPIGSTIQIDLYVNPVKLSPVGVQMSLLTPPVPNGVTTTFDLTLVESGDSISPGGPQDLEIYVDGVRQRPGVDYDVVLNEITFTTAPHVTSVIWGLYYLPFTGAGTGGGGDLPEGNQEGDTLQTNGDLVWIAKQNVDAGTI
jgi:hypothetical protein